MNKTEKIEKIKNIVKNNGEMEVAITINKVDFDYIDYYADTDTAFLFSYEHDIECDVNETLRECFIDQILEDIC